MYKRANVDLPELVRGTTYSVTINLTDENGDPLDLSWATGVRGYIRSTVDSGTIILQPVWSITAPSSGGVISTSTASTSTDGISTGRFVYDAEAYDGGSPPRVEPLLYGKILVVKEVTRT